MKLFNHTAKSSKKHSGFSLKNHLHEISRDAFSDWALIVTIFITIALILVMTGFLSYIRLKERLQGSSGIDPVIVRTINEQELGKVLTTFEIRASERAAAAKGYNGPGDPSL